VAAKEVREEAGLEVEPVRLVGVLDKQKHPHPPSPYYTYKIFIECRILGGTAQSGMETCGVGFFGPDELPPLSTDRITASQIRWLFEDHCQNRGSAVFD
jgi:ADP-ribose pyrophosphatase YjhB (NUDIX family)